MGGSSLWRCVDDAGDVAAVAVGGEAAGGTVPRGTDAAEGWFGLAVLRFDLKRY